MRRMDAITLSRLALYTRVWTVPMHHLAKEFGRSARGLSLICKREHIPTPKRGYWQRKANGYRVRQPPLLGSKDTVITVEPLDRVGHRIVAGEFKHPLVEFERKPENRIVVPEKVALKHPLVLATREYYRSKAAHAAIRHRQRLDVVVSQGALARALVIMEVLLRGLEQREFPVHVVGWTRTIVRVLDQDVEMCLREKGRPIPGDVPADVRRERAETREWLPQGHPPSGILQLRCYSGQVRDDERGRRLEDRLNEFIELIVRSALRQREKKV